MKKIFSIYKIKHFIALLLICVLGASCKKWVEPPLPKDRIEPEVLFSDSATAVTALAGIYHNLGYYEYIEGINGELLTRWPSLSSDELVTSFNAANWKQFEEVSLRPENGNVATFWGSAYEGIYRINATLEELGKSSGLKHSLKQQWSAEIKAVRALYYFNLVNLFGDVPLVTNTDFRLNATLPRASVNAVYDLIIADLTEAKQTLPSAYPSFGRARPNRHVATALLAKVYLYRENWASAETMAMEVINSGEYSLVNDLNNVFLSGSTEAIWQLPAIGGINTQVQEGTTFVPFSSTSVPQYSLTQSLLSAFDTADQRRMKWLQANTVGADTFYYPFKYKNRLPNATPQEDYVMLRLAEVYLILAEALAHQNKLTEALLYLNQIRIRAGLPAINPAIQTAMLDAIMQERRIELFTERANRWFDLKRTGMANAVLGALKGANWQPTDSLYPIPTAQLLNNPFLTQNPGY